MTGTGKPLVPTEFEMPAPAADEVVIEIAGCGVGESDLGCYYDGVRPRHALPLTLGHEISGHVVDAGANALWYTDRAVIVPAAIPCGRCAACRRGSSSSCQNRKMPGNDIHGGFATHITVPVHGLCTVDERRIADAGIDLADLAAVADAVTCAYQAVIQAGVRKGDLVVVCGAGGVGGYVAQIAAALGGMVVAVDVNEAAPAAFAGAALVLDARHMTPRDINSAIQDYANRNDLRRSWTIFECSGTRAGRETAQRLLNPGAKLVPVGVTMDEVETRPSGDMAPDARGCPPDLYPAALELVLNGRVKVGQFVEKHPLRDINQVFEAAHAGALRRHAVLVPEL
jgi:6-hydroxycyclohex-1-ene-1-carbonyl-CoA dehydrogenase